MIDNVPSWPLELKTSLRFGSNVWVDENFRVIFRFDGEHAAEVNYVDYH